MDKVKAWIGKIPWERLAVRLVASILLADSLLLIFSKTGYDVLAYVNMISLVRFLAYTALVWIVLSINKSIAQKFPLDEWALLISGFFYATVVLLRKNDFYISLGVLIGLGLLLWYLVRGDKLRIIGKFSSEKFVRGAVIAMAVGFALFVGITTAFRYLSYRTPGYDFGIFSQMFYRMRDTGLPMVSCERDRVLSHFAVHISPIFYLLLPGFYLFPSPAYLEVAQAVLLASGMIPLYLLCREKKLGNLFTVIVCFCYAAFPALASGCYYDIHENKFLAPLILWLMYFIEKEKLWGIVVFSILTLLVKEDAAIYVACIALFLFFGKKKFLQGGLLLVGSVLYFGGVVYLLNHYGDGVMTYRYDNFIADPEAGLLGMFKTILVNPVYFLLECFNPEKLQFLFLMLLPLGLLPVINRKFSQFILLIPMLLMNLMSDYPYQHSIYFQYTYGVTALLFYLTVINLADFKKGEGKRWLAAFMASAALAFSVAELPGRFRCVNVYQDQHQLITEMDRALSDIPKGASVRASTFLIAHLADRELLFQVDSKHETDYVIFDDREGFIEEKRTQLETDYRNDGYITKEYIPGGLLILEKQ